MCVINTSTEGTNFEMADSLYVEGFNALSTVRARQTLGRVRRPNNPNKNIKVFFEPISAANPIQLIKSRLNQYYALNHDCKNFEKKPEEIMRNIVAKLTADEQIDYTGLNDKELIMLFTYQHKDAFEFDESDFRTMTPIKMIQYMLL